MSICHSSFLHTHKRPKIVVCLNKGNEANKKDVVKLLDRHPLFHTIYILKYLSKDFLEIRGRPAAYGVSVKKRRPMHRNKDCKKRSDFIIHCMFRNSIRNHVNIHPLGW